MADESTSLEPITKLILSSLGRCDVALMNLRAAHGLPGTETLDEEALSAKLDEWANRCKFEIWRHLYRIERQISEAPTEFSYGNSLGRLCCWYMLQVLQEDCGVAYHPDRKFNPDFCRPEDIFIHGIVDDGGQGGTCASMPVVYVAIGQRLGLPVHLVQTRGHLFFRWDDSRGTLIDWDSPRVQVWIPPDRFNVEGSGEGIAFPGDDHYRVWPEIWTAADIHHDRYLRSMNPTEVLAEFLIQRAECFYDLRDWDNSLKSIHYARQLAPEDRRYQSLHAKYTREFQQQQASAQRNSIINRIRHAAPVSRPGMPGHSRGCCCGGCDEYRNAAASLPVAPHGGGGRCKACQQAAAAQSGLVSVFGHRLNCACFECQQLRDMAKTGPVPPHGMSCQCANCTTARSANESARGISGHPMDCSCFTCTERRNTPQRMPGFGPPSRLTPNFGPAFPTITAFPAPGFPRLPGT